MPRRKIDQRYFFLALVIPVCLIGCCGCADYSQYENVIAKEWRCDTAHFESENANQDASYIFICNEDNTWCLIDAAANNLELCRGSWKITYASKPPKDYANQSFSHHSISGDLFTDAYGSPAGSFEYKYTKMFSSGELKYLDNPVMNVEIHFDGKEISLHCQDPIPSEEKWTLTYRLSLDALIQ